MRIVLNTSQTNSKTKGTLTGKLQKINLIIKVTCLFSHLLLLALFQIHPALPSFPLCLPLYIFILTPKDN